MTSISLRPIRADDLPEVWALHVRSEAHDRIPRVLVLDELEEELDDEEVLLATDTRLAIVDGRPAGYAYTRWFPSPVRLERAYVFGQVDPDARGLGVGRELLAWGVARAEEQLRSSDSDLPKVVRVDAYDYLDSAHRLYARAGFTPVRWFEELLRSLDDLPARTSLDGIRIEPWDAARDEEIRLVKNESFADHWGSTPISVESWQSMVHGFGGRPDLSFLAIDDATDAVVGFCLAHRYEADDEVAGRRDGWVEQLGTLAGFRGRGVASALLVEALHAFAGADLSHASIGVDSDSPTGAARLYRSLGFEPRQRSITHEIALA
jgi:ribosomal protein S18 acetylase RimI-like enzyme